MIFIILVSDAERELDLFELCPLISCLQRCLPSSLLAPSPFQSEDTASVFKSTNILDRMILQLPYDSIFRLSEVTMHSLPLVFVWLSLGL